MSKFNFGIESVRMKYLIILPYLVISANALFSQNGTTGVMMGQDFTQLAQNQSNTKGGISPSAFQSYSSRDVDGTQFFMGGWKSGEVVTMKKEAYGEGIQFCYDKVRQELFIRRNDSSLILLANKDEILSFSLKHDGKKYNFINSSLFSDSRPEVFYQVLVYDSLKLTLLKYIKTAFVKADPTDMMKQREGDIYDAFVDRYTYYIVKNRGIPEPVQLRTKSLKKVFANLQIDPEKYMSDHPEPIDEDYLIDMISQLNQ
jgi:hypothetical protein